MSSLFVKLKNWKWLYPILMVICFYFMTKLGFSEVPLINRVPQPTNQGQVPEVMFMPSARLILLVVLFFAFFTIFFLILRRWAHYYLNRKMVLSYLFFALIPLLTTVLIFFAILRVFVGVSNLLAFESTVDQRGSELAAFAQNLHHNLPSDLLQGYKAIVRERVNRSRNQELGGMGSLGRDLSVEILYRTDKQPGIPRILVPIYSSEGSIKEDTIYTEHTPEYDNWDPSWLKEDKWTGVINTNEDLEIRHYSVSEDYLIITSLPINQDFLKQLAPFGVVRITLENNNQTRYINTTGGQTQWYFRLPFLQVLDTRWDSGAFDWKSGFFEPYGSISFSVELAGLGGVIGNTGLLSFFYTGQKTSSIKLILGVVLLVILCELIAFVFGAYLISYITRSLNVIAEGHEHVAGGNLNYRLPYLGKDQLGAMGRSFNGMVSSIDSLMNQVAEKEKYHEELRIARDIQMSLLPKIEDLDWASNIAANCIPARDVGGDYYEILHTKRGEIGIFIADVSGKGTSAAFYMAELKGVLIALRHLWNKPRELMLDLNEIMGTTLSSNVFISAAYLLIDPYAKRGFLARAGHCPAFHIKHDGEVDELVPPGMAIGITNNDVFGRIMKVVNFPMEKDDKIVLYTDGLDEMTHHNEMYGIDRLKTVLRNNTKRDVDELKNIILDDVLNFLSTDIQNDDLTLVVAGLPDTASAVSLGAA